MLIVFVTNKIITTDTILPVLLEAKQRKNQLIVIVVSRKNGFSVIEQNVVINDLINSIGFKFLLGGRLRVRWVKRLIGSVQFLLILIAGFFGAKFIHFDKIPLLTLKILSFFFGPRLFYSERDSIKHDFFKLPHRQTNKFGTHYSQGEYPLPLGGNIISYNKDKLYYFHGPDIHQKRDVYFLNSPRSRISWIDYVDNVSDKYFEKFHKNIEFKNGIIFIILSFYDVEPEKEEYNLRMSGRGVIYQKKLRQNFENTVNVLSSIKGDIPVFLKPAAYTDMDYVNSILMGHKGFYITYLHPSILLRSSRFVVCNWYSTILGDAHNLEVPTVEYSYYPENLRQDLGYSKTALDSIGSEYVDWFIYDDINRFKQVVSELIKKDFIRKKPVIEDHLENNSLFDKLC